MEFARRSMLREEAFDDVLCAIRGTGVADDPVVDQRQYGFETPGDHGRLVLHDHTQADFLSRHGLQTCSDHYLRRDRFRLLQVKAWRCAAPSGSSYRVA